MSKNLKIFLVLAVLSVLTYFILQKKKSAGALSEVESTFAIEDTGTVDRIFIAKKDGGKVDLVKENGVWLVNGKFPARLDAVDLLLETFRNVEVLYPTSESMKPRVLQIMATTGTKVEVFQEGKRTRIWIMGNETADLKGSNVLAVDPESGENFDNPYVLHIPGFEGFLNPRFFVNEYDWRDRTILGVSPLNIVSVKAESIEYPDSSFTIQVRDMRKNDFDVILPQGKLRNADSLAVRQYLAYFLNLTCEKFLGDSLTLEEDSVLRLGKPFLNLYVKTRENNETVLRFFHKKPQPQNSVQYGVKLKYDPNYVFIKSNKDKDFSLGQALTYGKVLQTGGYFKSRTVKN
jgi:hypothetical protein